MRVAFFTRRDAFVLRGGDTVQLEKTASHLAQLGVEVEVNPRLENGRTYSLAHIFNVQDPHQTAAHLQYCRRAGLPVVISPIYWDTSYQKTGVYREIARSIVRHESLPVVLRGFERIPTFRAAAIKWRLARWCLNEVDQVLPNSIAELEGIIHTFKLTRLRAKSTIVYNGVDSEWFVEHVSKLVPECERRGVVCVGRIEPAKGQLELIAGFLKTDIPNLTFVGYVHDTEYYRRCVSLASATDRVRFIPPLDHDELVNVYDAHRVHCLLSARESPGLVSIEAFARGCSLVVSEHCPFNEYFADIAVIAARDSVDSVANALQRQYVSPVFPTYEHQYQYSKERFVWSNIAAQTLKSYHELLTRWRS
jgi:glycosyltransferase involved in cell wall biosynthesis